MYVLRVGNVALAPDLGAPTTHLGCARSVLTSDAILRIGWRGSRGLFKIRPGPRIQNAYEVLVPASPRPVPYMANPSSHHHSMKDIATNAATSIKVTFSYQRRVTHAMQLSSIP
jgi:hypothetical protein